ncbi:MAG: serine protease [Patescibacteria group bacterium]|nr:serine protease [Patescibacteria group bacterium]
MINIFEKQFDNLANKIKFRWKNLTSRLKAYFKKLLFPLYLFPFKLLTYTVYYLVKFLIKLIFAFIGLIVDCIVYPFKGLKNFLKSIFIVGVILYLFASLFVIGDYLTKQYGWWGKFLCSVGVREKLQDSVVRIVGGYSEGSGFFVADNQILTNFHVIADEPSPKVIFPDGSFVTPVKITGDKDADLAILFIEENHPDKVLEFLEPYGLLEEEPLISAGYPLGTDLSGEATVVKGNFITFRQSRYYPVAYVHTTINLVEGMSGGPLVDQCGYVVGVNTMDLSGMSLFVSADEVQRLIPAFTDQEIAKIEVNPSISPEEAVRAFYTYLKARRMRDGFNLLSKEYLEKTNFEEWTNRFTDILDVQIFVSKLDEEADDIVFVKFATKNWNQGEVDYHYYEGTWQTVLEDGVYKMLKSKILEVGDPGWDWFYE